MSQEELRAYRGATVIKEKNEQPHTFVMLYPPPADTNAFEREYLSEHVALARKLPAKALRTDVVGGTLSGDAAPYHRIVALHFDDLRSLQQCAQSQEAKTALEHAEKISSGGKPQLLVLESDMAIDEEPGQKRPPVKFMVCFPHPEDQEAFDTVYLDEVLPVMLKLPAKQFKGYKAIATADGAESPLHRILEFFFDSQANLESSMTSASGKALLDALQKIPSPPLLLIAAEG